jgi:hypothetical protein
VTADLTVVKSMKRIIFDLIHWTKSLPFISSYRRLFHMLPLKNRLLLTKKKMKEQEINNLLLNFSPFYQIKMERGTVIFFSLKKK